MALIGMKYVNPDSVLARTAWEMVQTHAGGLGPHDGMTVCPVCGETLPCTAGQAAADVVAAAGLAESSGLVAAARQGRGGPERDPASSLGLPGLPAPTPAAGSAAGSPAESSPAWTANPPTAFERPSFPPPPDPALPAGPQPLATPSFDVPREPASPQSFASLSPLDAGPDHRTRPGSPHADGIEMPERWAQGSDQPQGAMSPVPLGPDAFGRPSSGLTASEQDRAGQPAFGHDSGVPHTGQFTSGMGGVGSGTSGLTPPGPDAFGPALAAKPAGAFSELESTAVQPPSGPSTFAQPSSPQRSFGDSLARPPFDHEPPADDGAADDAAAGDWAAGGWAADDGAAGDGDADGAASAQLEADLADTVRLDADRPDASRPAAAQGGLYGRGAPGDPAEPDGRSPGQPGTGRAAQPERPRVVPDVDPLLLGPPLFARQNRPLDAPRFTASVPVPEPTDPAQYPLPSNGATPDAPQLSETTDRPGFPSHLDLSHPDPAHHLRPIQQPDPVREADAMPAPDGQQFGPALQPGAAPPPGAAARPGAAPQPDGQQFGPAPQPGGQQPDPAQQPGPDQPQQSGITPATWTGELTGPPRPSQTDRPGPFPPATEARQPGAEDQFVRPPQPGTSASVQATEPAALGRPAAPVRPEAPTNVFGLPEAPTNVFGLPVTPAHPDSQPSGLGRPDLAPAANPSRQDEAPAQQGGSQQGSSQQGDPAPARQPAPPEQAGPTPAVPPRRPGRPPLESPQMGQLNRPLDPAATPARPPAAPHHHPGAPQAAPSSGLTKPTTRPPLEPPQMGQLNRPLQPPPADDATTPSGLAAVRPGAPETPAVRPPAVPAAPPGAPAEEAPSGLPPRPQQSTRPDPEAEQDRAVPNG